MSFGLWFERYILGHYEGKQKLTLTSRTGDFYGQIRRGWVYGRPHKKTSTDPSGSPARGNGHADQIAGSARFSPGAKTALKWFLFFSPSSFFFTIIVFFFFFFLIIRPASYQAYFKWHVAPPETRSKRVGVAGMTEPL